jgi:hypothetical protein
LDCQIIDVGTFSVSFELPQGFGTGSGVTTGRVVAACVLVSILSGEAGVHFDVPVN